MTVNDSLAVSNASGGPIVVLNATNSVANVQSNSTQQGYLQDLSYLPLSGGNVLADGGSATATLDGTYVDSNGQTQPNYVYNLLVSRPGSLFPVMAAGTRLDFKSMAYPPLAATKAAADAMTKAYAFCQNIMTAPSSKMAADFQATLTSAFKTGTITEAEAQIADFFNRYDPFKGLDFPSYVAMSTWLKGFAYAWGMNGQGLPGQTYYVYAAPAEGKSGTTSHGTIVFAANAAAPDPADPTDRQSGMTITLDSGSGSSQALTFDGGMLTDGAGGAVALHCSWGYQGTFTGKGTDATVIPILAGTILNSSVIAIPIAPESGFDKFWSGLSFSKLFGYFMQAMGLWMALDFLKQKLTAKDEKLKNDEGNENKGGEPDAKQVADAEKSGTEVGDKTLADNQAKADRIAPEDSPQVPTDDAAFGSAVEEVRAEASSALDQVATDNASGAIDSAETQIDNLAQIENTPALETATTELVNAQQSLADGDIPAATESIGNVNEALPTALKELGDNVSAEMKAEVEAAVEAQVEAADVAAETAETSDATETGDEEPFEAGEIPEI